MEVCPKLRSHLYFALPLHRSNARIPMRSGARPKCDPVFSPPASRHGTALLLWLEAFITALLLTYLSSGVWFILLGPYLCIDSIKFSPLVKGV